MMNNELRPYDNYKSIDLPWLNSIPEHWSVSRNKNMMFQAKSLVGGNHHNYKLLSLTLNGVIARDMVNPKGKFPKEFDTYQIVNQKDLVFCLFDIDETPRTVGISPLEGMITGAYTVFNVKNANERYVYYYYLALDNNKMLKPLYTGLRKVISADTFLRTKLPIPPRLEQDQIVKYLDHQLAKINKFIKAKKKLITVLKEQKQAIINEVVTKGLNPDVKMKTSGIEWIGEVPEHWDIIKLKYLSKESFQYGANESGYQYEDNAYRYIRITDISQNGDLKTEGALFLPEAIGANYRLRDGDILFARSGATVGKSFLFKDEYGSSSYAGYLIKFAPDRSKVLPEYVYFYTMSSAYSQWLNQVFIQSTIQNVSAEKYKNLVISLPSLDEQAKLLIYIKEKSEVFDKSIVRVLSEIELIQEYKNSLISDVVTGKVDVRNIIIEELDEKIIEDIELDEDSIDEEILEAEDGDE